MISKVCLEDNCIGCALCESICPQNAISIEIRNGFYRPKISETCISCGACVKNCLAHKTIQKNNATDSVYAAWCKDKELHYQSSSGGLAYKIAYEFIKNGGAVAGVWFNPVSQTVEHRIYEDINGLEKMRGSRYVQSNKAGMFYRLVKEKLEEKKVLFIGVPCEVFAIKTFIATKKPTPYQFFCIDTLCRGGSSPYCLQEHIKAITHNKPINDVKFRGGKDDCRFTLWNKNGKRTFMCLQYYDAYFLAFMKHSIFQNACYSCKFTGVERVGDLTLGDFWGLDKKIEQQTDIRGVNLLFVNTSAGEELIRSVKSELVMIPRPIEEAVLGNDTLREPTPKPDEYEKLWTIIKREGFHKAMKKIYGIDWRKNIVTCYAEMIKTKAFMLIRRK